MKKKNLIKITLLLSAMFTMMAGAIVAPSLPAIERIFQHTENIGLLTRLILSLPAIFTAIFSPIFGSLSDKLGRKRLLLLSLLLYAIGGVSGFLLNDIYMILAGRALLGIAVAGIMTISSTLIGDHFKGAERNKFIGLQGAFMGFGGVLFVSLAGILADIRWDLPFLIYLLSITALVTACLSISDSTNTANTLTNNSGEGPYKLQAVKIYFLVFTGILFFYLMPVQLPFLMDKLENMTNAKIGYALAIMQLSSALIGLKYKSIKERFSFSTIYMMILILMGCGYLMIAYCQQYILILMALCIAGLGVGLLMPLGNLWIMQIAPEERRGAMVGNVTTSVFLGQFLSPLLFQRAINSLGVSHLFLGAGLGMIIFAALIYMGSKSKKKVQDRKHEMLQG